MDKIRKCKKCVKCKRRKSVGCFSDSTETKDGKKVKCKTCEKKDQERKLERYELPLLTVEKPKIINPYAFVGIPKNKDEINSKMNRVLKIICTYLDVAPEEVIRDGRKASLVYARQAFCYFALSKIRGVTLKKVGKFLGGRDHTTVMHNRNVYIDLVGVESIVHSSVKHTTGNYKLDYEQLNQLL